MTYSSEKILTVFLVTVAIVLFCNLGIWGLAETSEARYAEIGREMLLSGDYLNPQFLGIYHYHKPPMAYYFTALGFSIFGINEFGARFFLQLGILVQLLLVYKLVMLLLNNKRTALFTVICYFTMPVVIMADRNVTTDVYLTTFIMLAIYGWLYYIKQPKALWGLYVYYISIGLALETKGPVALLFIFGFTALYSLLFKHRFKLTIHHIIGFVLGFGIGGVWYVMVIIEKPELLNYFVFRQTVSRIADQSFHRDQPIFFYVLILAGVLFPYSIALVTKMKKLYNSTIADKFVLIYTLGLVVVFSLFKTKRILYLMPLFWTFSIAIVRAMEMVKPKLLNAIQKSYAALLGLYVLGCIVLFSVTIAAIEISVTHLLITLVLGGVLLYFIFSEYVKKDVESTLYVAGGFFAILIVTGGFFMKNNSTHINSFKPIVAFIEADEAHEEKKIFAFDYLIGSIPFYTNIDFYTLNYLHDTVVRDIQFQGDERWKEHHINVYLTEEAARMKQLLSSGKNYMLVKKKYGLVAPFGYVEQLLPNQKDFGKWVLYYN